MSTFVVNRTNGALNAQQADLAYEMSACATSALITRIGASNLGFLLQDLDRGHTSKRQSSASA